MKHLLRRLFMSAAISLVGFSQPALAAGWTNVGTITEIQNQASTDTIVISTTGITTNPSGCTNSSVFYLAISTDRHKRYFAMLLTAQASGASVQFYTTGTCSSGNAQLDGVVVKS